MQVAQKKYNFIVCSQGFSPDNYLFYPQSFVSSYLTRELVPRPWLKITRSQTLAENNSFPDSG